LEFMMNGLRLNQGFPIALFTQRTGLTITSIQHKLDQLVERQLLIVDNHRIYPSPLGRNFLNDILATFTPE
jgi:coproporphyrinogen III oxidase-like Fe-S oxidoreductase